MQSNIRRVGLTLALAVLAAAALLVGPAGGAAELRGCGAFEHQADAQAYFVEVGGRINHSIRSLDPDGDGVACEELSAPYAGYATLRYNRKDRFFYGTATMPQSPVGTEPFACLTGNRHFPEGPRRFSIYRVGSTRDQPLFKTHGLAAEPRRASGRLIWRADRKQVPPGRYYVEFEERVRTTPFGQNECPAFSSRAVRLP